MTGRVEDFLAAQSSARPQAPALSDSLDQRWTFAELDRAAQAGQTVLSGVGVGPGDRVVIVLENCNAAVAMLFAAWRLGAVAVPINARQSPPELARVLAHAGPAAVVYTSLASPDAAQHAAGAGATRHQGAFGMIDVAAHPRGAPAPDPDLAVLLYTTGTTGTPKGVMLSHANLRFGGLASARLRQMTADDLIYGVLPMTHVFGLASVMVAAVSAGCPIRLEARFSAATLYQALQDGVSLLPAVPQMHALLMQYTQSKAMPRLGSTRLRYVSSGAAPLDPECKRKAEAFYGVALQNGYGLTETTAGVCATTHPIGLADISVGPPLPGVQIRIDPATNEILTQGPNVMLGYFNNPQDTAAAFAADGWLRTGDLGRIDDKGQLHILGRLKELIIHGGFNVYPPEVEAALNAHPQVIQSAVIGRPRNGDEDILAFVQVADENALQPETLHTFVKDRLAGYKRPAQIILTTNLPTAPTGKILKHRLLDSFADHLT